MKAFLLVCTTIIAMAADLPAIEKAQKLLLENRRVQAIDTLVSAISKETNVKLKAKMRSVLTLVSQDFLTENGQKFFEVGLSIEHPNPTLAVQKYTEALAEEDSNLLVLLALARTKIVLRQCKEALDLVEKGLKMNPYFDELSAAKASSLICLGDKDSAKTQIRALEKTDLPSWRTKWLKSQLSITDASQEAARTLLEQVRHEAQHFPEVFYALWKLNPEGRAEFGKRYVLLCKNLSAKVKQEYRFESDLCAHADEVQAELEKRQKVLDEDNEK